jgi:hypothetical protein
MEYVGIFMAPHSAILANNIHTAMERSLVCKLIQNDYTISKPVAITIIFTLTDFFHLV